MSRLIDADALKKQFKDRSLEDFTHLHFIDAIDNAPTIEHEDNSKLHYAIGYNEGYTDGYKQAVIELKHGLERRLRGDV